MFISNTDKKSLIKVLEILIDRVEKHEKRINELENRLSVKKQKKRQS